MLYVDSVSSNSRAQNGEESVQSEKLQETETSEHQGQHKQRQRQTVAVTTTTSSQTASPFNSHSSENGAFFDFQLFISELRQPTALPLIKYTKSFLYNFCTQNAKHRRKYEEQTTNNNINSLNSIWTADEQAKLIKDFKVFIYDKLGLYEPFKSMDELHLLNAKEGMEKLIMGKLYTRCFSPLALRSGTNFDGTKLGGVVITRPGDLHRDDLVQDRLLKRKILEYRFIKLSNLDVGSSSSSSSNTQAVGSVGTDKFVKLAGRELNKINDYKSPRDKVVCILNCCKVIFGLLRHYKLENGGADSFIPMLIYVVLKNDVDNLVSNIRFIERFRYDEFLKGEEEYYLSSLQGATKFVINMERKDLNIEDEVEFQRNYEANQKLLEEEGLEAKLEEEQDILYNKEVRAEEEEEKEGEKGTLPINNTSFTSTNPFGDITSSMKSLFSDLFTTAATAANDDDEQETPSRDQDTRRPNRDNNRKSKTDKRKARPLDLDTGNSQSEHENENQDESESLEAIIKKIEERDRRDTVATLSSMFPDLPRDLVEDVCTAQKYRIAVCIDTLLEFYEQN